MSSLLDDRRLGDQAGARHPELHRGIALRWIAGLPAAAERIRGTRAEELPAALHELRSGAVAVGLVALAGVLAGIEQAVEAGRPVAPGALDDALALAERSAAELHGFWAAAAPAPPDPGGDR